MYSRRAGCCARGVGVAARLETAWIGLLIDGYRLPKRRNFFDAERAALPAAHAGAARRGVEHAPGERVELRGDVAVARERQRHARIERRRYGLVVSREVVMNRVADRILVLLRRNHVLLER